MDKLEHLETFSFDGNVSHNQNLWLILFFIWLNWAPRVIK